MKKVIDLCAMHVKKKADLILTTVDEEVVGTSFLIVAASVFGYLLTGLAFDDVLLGNCK